MDRARRSAADRKRDLILDVAALLKRTGRPFTIQLLADEAGVARATVYRYFRDVAAVERALATEAVNAGKRAARSRLVESSRSGTCSGPLTTHLLYVAGGLINSDGRWRTAVLGAHQDVFYDEFAPVLRSLIAKAQSRGEIPADIDGETTSLAIITLTTLAIRAVLTTGMPPTRAADPLQRFVHSLGVGPNQSASPQRDS